MKDASLPPHILKIVKDKGTEFPFSGEYNAAMSAGTYLCRRCGLALFRSHSKFESPCGWPSFHEEIENAVRRQGDADGQRIEILCSRCQGHLGHVFEGEGITPMNTRYCVNSLSIDFVPNSEVKDTEEAIFAAGCFWGVEYYFKRLPGVLKVEVGYTGGHQNAPTYEDVCTGRTGHLEAVRVVYDPTLIDYEEVTKYFFEIHDATQANGQGPDLGEQYLSAIFYYDNMQQSVAQSLIKILKEKGYRIVTKIVPVSIFWAAEDYHQDYYQKNGKNPYCHHYTKLF